MLLWLKENQFTTKVLLTPSYIIYNNSLETLVLNAHRDNL